MGRKILICEACGSSMKQFDDSYAVCTNPGCLGEFVKRATEWYFQTSPMICEDCGAVMELTADGETYICPSCGGYAVWDDIDTHHSFYSAPLKVCPNCEGLMEMTDTYTITCDDCKDYYEFSLADKSWIFNGHEGDYNTTYSDSRPKQCTGCGSDMYPDCQYSCKLFDD